MLEIMKDMKSDAVHHVFIVSSATRYASLVLEALHESDRTVEVENLVLHCPNDPSIDVGYLLAGNVRKVEIHSSCKFLSRRFVVTDI
jgi:hypothetical protein